MGLYVWFRDENEGDYKRSTNQNDDDEWDYKRSSEESTSATAIATRIVSDIFVTNSAVKIKVGKVTTSKRINMMFSYFFRGWCTFAPRSFQVEPCTVGLVSWRLWKIDSQDLSRRTACRDSVRAVFLRGVTSFFLQYSYTLFSDDIITRYPFTCPLPDLNGSDNTF